MLGHPPRPLSARVAGDGGDGGMDGSLLRITQSMTTQSLRVWRPGRATLAVPLLLLAVCYATTVTAMAEVWSTNPVYSYGFLVPVISAYICWSGWQEHPALG